MLSLDEIVSKTLRFDAQVNSEARGLAESLVLHGNTAMEVAHLLAENEAPSHLRALLTNAIDQAFMDLHVAVSLAACGRQKQAFVIARAWLEVLLYCLYFTDHPVEARLWTSSRGDMSFSEVVGQMNKHYFSAALCPEPTEEKLTKSCGRLRDTYRFMSEQLHGQGSFSDSWTQQKPSEGLRQFGAVFDVGILELTYLMSCRVRDVASAAQKIPAIRELFPT